MSLKSLISAVLAHGDNLADAWKALQEGAKRVSYPQYESACIAVVANKYGINLNEDGTIPKAEQAAYQRIKRLRRAHPEFVKGATSAKKETLKPAVQKAFETHVLSLGLTKAQLRVLFEQTLKGLK